MVRRYQGCIWYVFRERVVKLAALVVLTVSLILAGFAMDDLVERSECARLRADDLPHNIVCADYTPPSRPMGKTEWAASGFLLITSLVLFRTGKHRVPRSADVVRTDLQAATLVDHV